MKQVNGILNKFNKAISQLGRVSTANRGQAERNDADILKLQENNVELLEEADYAAAVQEKLKDLLKV